ncbi:12582_t:CDS:2, partial [Dentiscutata heterogama]
KEICCGIQVDSPAITKIVKINRVTIPELTSIFWGMSKAE